MQERPGEVITFYSYKGGTGRTMALANTAYQLAREGRGKVLMIDWDLEAPGLHEFFPEIAVRERAENSLSLGVIEFFANAFETASKADAPDYRLAEDFWRALDPFAQIRETDLPSLHLLRAGLIDNTYGERVSGFPWQELFGRWPAVFHALIDRLSRSYRYILIDSRTGLTDTAGICTSLLPDHLVAVFTPNRQSLEGVTSLLRTAISYRGESPDLRPLLVFPLASRVEMSEDGLRRDWRYGDGEELGYQLRFERLFERAYDLESCDLEAYFDEIQIQHVTAYAYGERVAVREESSDRLSLSRSYERFTKALVEANSPWTFEREGQKVRTYEGAERLLERIADDCKTHWRISARQRFRNQIFLGVEIAAIAGSVLVALGVWINAQISPEEFASPNELLPILLIGVILAGGLEFFRRLFSFDRTSVIHARTANALDRERTLFEGHAGAYSSEGDPARLLAERYGEIRVQAEDALMEQGSPEAIKRIGSGRSGSSL